MGCGGLWEFGIVSRRRSFVLELRERLDHVKYIKTERADFTSLSLVSFHFLTLFELRCGRDVRRDRTVSAWWGCR